MLYTSYIPSPALGLHLRPTEFVVSVKYRLGLDIFLSEGKCTACPHQSDKLGDHAVSQAVMSKHVEDEHRIKKRKNVQALPQTLRHGKRKTLTLTISLKVRKM